MSKYLLTRPALAAELMEAGCDVAVCPNPFNADLKAWKVELDSVALCVIADYYREIKKPLPAVVAAAMEARKAEC